MTQPRAAGVDAVAQDLAAVWRLARHLTRDAEDLTQDVAVIALQRSRAQHPGEPWLKGVARRLLLVRLRSERRRVQRELRCAWRPSASSPSDDAACAEIAGILADETHRLAEPYRTAIALRYFAQLEPHEIAVRLRVPAATARSRVKRGLEQLRDRLDRRFGARDHWYRALVPLVLCAPHPRTGGARSWWLRAAAAGACALVTLSVLVSVFDRKSEARAVARLAERGVAQGTSPRPERRELRQSSPVDAERPPPMRWSLHGQLVGLHAGSPWTSELVVSGAGSTTTVPVAADGSFHADLEVLRGHATSPRMLTIEADDPWYLPAHELVRVRDGHGLLAGEASFTMRMIVQRACVAHGRVVNELGEPVPGAHLLVMESSPQPARCEAFTDAAGGFRLRVAPEGTARIAVSFSPRAAPLHAALDARPALLPRLVEVSLALGHERELPEIVLATGASLRGRAVRADGTPLCFARVLARPVSPPEFGPPAVMGEADADGMFAITGLWPGEHLVQIASVRDPAVFPSERTLGSELVHALAPGANVVVPMDRVLATITVMSDGRARPGARVSVMRFEPTAKQWQFPFAIGATDASGRVGVYLGRGECYAATVVCEGFRTTHVELATSSPRPILDAAVDLKREPEPSGRFRMKLCEVDGQPFCGSVWLGLEPLDRQAGGLRERYEPECRGTIEAAHLAGGRWRVEVRGGADEFGEGALFACEPRVVEVRDPDAAPIAVSLSAGGMLEMRAFALDAQGLQASCIVRDHESREVPILWRWPRADGPGLLCSTLCFAQVSAASSPLPPGPYTVEVIAAGCRTQRLEFTIQPLRTTRLTVAMEREPAVAHGARSGE